MKIISFKKLILCGILILIILNFIECGKMASLASFMSSSRLRDLLLKAKKARARGNAAPTPTPPPTPPSQQTQPVQKAPAPTPPPGDNIPKNKYNELPDNNTLHEGWVKYIHYRSGEIAKPNAFFKNEMYDKQIPKNPPIPDDDVYKIY